MPLASILAALAGVIMLFWRKTVGFFRASVAACSRTWQRLVGRSQS